MTIRAHLAYLTLLLHTQVGPLFWYYLQVVRTWWAYLAHLHHQKPAGAIAWAVVTAPRGVQVVQVCPEDFFAFVTKGLTFSGWSYLTPGGPT